MANNKSFSSSDFLSVSGELWWQSRKPNPLVQSFHGYSNRERTQFYANWIQFVSHTEHYREHLLLKSPWVWGTLYAYSIIGILRFSFYHFIHTNKQLFQQTMKKRKFHSFIKLCGSFFLWFCHHIIHHLIPIPIKISHEKPLNNKFHRTCQFQIDKKR